MKRLLFIVFVLLISSAQLMHAQLAENDKPSDTATVWQLLKYDAKYTLKGVGHSFTRPLHWKGDDFTKFGILLGGTAVMSFADNSVRDFIQDNAEGYPNVLRDIGWYFGSPQNYFMANAGLYGFGLLTKNEKVRKTSVLIISSSITTGLIQTISKNAIGRARPESGGDYLEFRPFANDAGFRAFPSGHTVLSITMAHSIAKQFENPWIKTGIYTVGAIAPISRLIDDAHWLTDIAFSTALSIIVVDCIDNFLFKEDAYDYPKREKRISWNFRFSANQIGIVGTF